MELAELRHIQPARPSQELHGHTNTLSNADQLTGHDFYHCHSGQTGLTGPSTVNYYDSVSRLRRDSEASVSLCLEPSPTQYHASSHAINSHVTFDTPTVSSSKRVERTVQSIDIASSQPSRNLNRPQFLSGDLILHTGKGEGRVPDSGRSLVVIRRLVMSRSPMSNKMPALTKPDIPTTCCRIHDLTVPCSQATVMERTHSWNVANTNRRDCSICMALAIVAQR